MKKYLSVALKSIIILCGTYGVINGLIEQRTVLQCLSYYTTLSNVLTVVVMCFALVAVLQDKTFCPFIKKGTTVCILLTFLIYHFALRPTVALEKYWRFSNFCLHYIVPLATFADFIIFDKKNDIKPYQPALWASFPIIYYIYILIYGAFGGYFLDKGDPIENATKAPYWFIDTAGKLPGTETVLGIPGVIISVGLCTIGFLILSYLIYATDLGCNALINKKKK